MRMGSAGPLAECHAISQQGPAETEWGRLRRPRRHFRDGRDVSPEPSPASILSRFGRHVEAVMLQEPTSR